MKTKPQKVVIGFSIPKQALEKIDELASDTGLSRSEYIRSLVLRHLEEKEKGD